MSDIALFGVGSLVTLLVVAAVALLVLGAMLDGRENDQARAEWGSDDVDGAGPSRRAPLTSAR